MTGIALDLLSLGSRPEWENVIYIDPNVLNRLTSWLIEQQNKTTGGFVRTSRFFDLKIMVRKTFLFSIFLILSLGN